MSVVLQSERASAPTSDIPLLATPDFARTLLWHAGAPVSVATFLAAVQALAAELPPARFAVNLCADRYGFLVAFCAAASAGQTNLLPPSRAPRAVQQLLHTHAGCYALLDDDFDCGDVQAFRFALRRFAAATPPASCPKVPAGHVVAIGYTSGSTGEPKANAKTWGSLCASTALNASLLGTDAAPAALVATVPAQHMYGLELSILLPLRSCASVHTGRPLFPADVAQALTEVPAPRVLVTTPFHLRALLQDDTALPAMAAIVSATAPLSADLARQAEQRLGTRVVEVFGSTETGVIAHRRTAYNDPWQLYPGVRLKPQPDGTLVEAQHFDAPASLQDIVELLPSRQFILCGRNSDLLEIAGKRASLGDLTQRLLGLPGVRDGVVFQLDADAAGVRRLAALVVAQPASEAAILAELRRDLDPVFVPRPLKCVAALPRNDAGKLPREALLGLLGKL